MSSLSIFPPVVSGTKRAARLNAKVARRMGWKRADIEVVNEGSDDESSIWVARVAGREFDVFTNKKLAAKLCEKFNVRVKNKTFKIIGVNHSMRVGGSEASDFYQSPQEALVHAILLAPRAHLRSFL